jgi:hypothetical protein
MSSPNQPVVVVHNAAHVRLAAEIAARLKAAPCLLTPPGAAAYAGVAYLRAMVAAAPELEAIIDCGAAPGHAMAAVRAGWREVHLTGKPDILARIEEMLDEVGGHLHRRLPPALDLADATDPSSELERWLAP